MLKNSRGGNVNFRRVLALLLIMATVLGIFLCVCSKFRSYRVRIMPNW